MSSKPGPRRQPPDLTCRKYYTSLTHLSGTNGSPKLREQLAAGHEKARSGLAALFQKIDDSTGEERSARTVGSFYLAVLSGLMC